MPGKKKSSRALIPTKARALSAKEFLDLADVPPEIEWFHERARLKGSVETATDLTERQKLQLKLTELEQKIALRLEALRMNSRL